MRKFYLENGQGKLLSLQSAELFFHKPQGLGFVDNRSYARAENGFYNETGIDFEQPNIVGEIVIRKDDYVTYGKLVDWFNQSGDMKLIYQPTKYRKLWMDVDLESVSLSEMMPYGTMEIPISMRGKTPYYTRETQTFSLRSNEAKEPMQFELLMPFRFSQNVVRDKMTYKAVGHFPAAVEFVANGPLIKPVLTAKEKSSGKLLGVMDASATSLQQGEQLRFSSRCNSSGIHKVTKDGSRDITHLLDISNNSFFTLPVGVEVELAFSCELAPSYKGASEHELSVYEYYKG